MQSLTPAARVWGTPELRSLIIDKMNLTDVHRSLCLSRNTLPNMVRVLYRRFDFLDYVGVLMLWVPVSPSRSAGVRRLINSTIAVTYMWSQYDLLKSQKI